MGRFAPWLPLAALCVTGCSAVLLLPTAVTQRPYSHEVCDASIIARLDEVAVRLDPQARTETFGQWDRYGMTLANPSASRVSITRISLQDSKQQEVPVPGAAPSPGGTQAAAGAALIAGGAAATGAGFATLPTVAYAGAAGPIGLVMGGAVVLAAGYDSVHQHVTEKNREERFALTRAQFPLVLEPGSARRIELWYPRTPHPSAIEIHYTGPRDEVLVMDTRELLADLHDANVAVPLVHPDGECPPEARSAGIASGFVRARLRVDGPGRVQAIAILVSEPGGVFDDEARRTFFNHWSFNAGNPIRETNAEMHFRCAAPGPS